jgi:hypothetical protein
MLYSHCNTYSAGGIKQDDETNIETLLADNSEWLDPETI